VELPASRPACGCTPTHLVLHHVPLPHGSIPLLDSLVPLILGSINLPAAAQQGQATGTEPQQRTCLEASVCMKRCPQGEAEAVVSQAEPADQWLCWQAGNLTHLEAQPARWLGVQLHTLALSVTTSSDLFCSCFIRCCIWCCRPSSMWPTLLTSTPPDPAAAALPPPSPAAAAAAAVDGPTAAEGVSPPAPAAAAAVGDCDLLKALRSAATSAASTPSGDEARSEGSGSPAAAAAAAAAAAMALRSRLPLSGSSLLRTVPAVAPLASACVGSTG
jgi:hypothetical protein